MYHAERARHDSTLVLKLVEVWREQRTPRFGRTSYNLICRLLASRSHLPNGGVIIWYAEQLTLRQNASYERQVTGSTSR